MNLFASNETKRRRGRRNGAECFIYSGEKTIAYRTVIYRFVLYVSYVKQVCNISVRNQEQFGPNLLEYNIKMKLWTISNSAHLLFSSNSDNV